MTPLKSAYRWLKIRLACHDMSENDKYYADNTRGHVVEFDPKIHPKYEAHVLFRDTENPNPNGPTALDRWQMSHPQRSTSAQKAYKDFLRGLEAIGAQEHLVGLKTWTGSHIDKEAPEDLEEILEHLMPGAAKPIDDLGPLHSIAEWERLVQLRKDAMIRREWYSTPERIPATLERCKI